MSMLPPVTPGQSTNAPEDRAAANRLGFMGPRPRLAGEGEIPGVVIGNTRSQNAIPTHADGKPRLRLVGAGAVVKPDLTPTEGVAIAGTSDPRWVLAVRVAEQLEGNILPPQKRDRLVRMGKMFGLTAFDANLIIAIVQDQARRGYAPAYCPTAGEPQLRMVPRPTRSPRAVRSRRLLTIATLLVTFVAIELLVVGWLF